MSTGPFLCIVSKS